MNHANTRFEPASQVDEEQISNLKTRYHDVREASRRLAADLSPEDQLPQSMPDASPTKWHLAHTTWFFETFVLGHAGVAPCNPSYGFLFNSYYEALGARHPRPQRGLLTRPSCEEVGHYRAYVDQAMERVIESGGLDSRARALIDLGLAHEEQHQELILTDVLHLFSCNALKPAYRRASPSTVASASVGAMEFVDFDGGVVEIGWRGEGFAFDNEGPAHEALLRPYRLADRLVTNGDWLEFVQDEGYRRPELWLSDGWAQVAAQGWTSPMYWESDGESSRDDWRTFALDGMQRLDPDAPVTHVSLYEADAFARWKGMRLPTEAEWENAARDLPVEGVFMETGRLKPAPVVKASSAGRPSLRQMFGDVWEWTASAYSPYPGFRPDAGAVGEYNGKFMINQCVLRGGSCATPRAHVRSTYRNFFQPHQRWQFSGVRLASDAG